MKITHGSREWLPYIFKVPLHDAGGIVITISFHIDGRFIFISCSWWWDLVSVFLGCRLHFKLIQGVSSIFVGFMLVTPV